MGVAREDDLERKLWMEIRGWEVEGQGVGEGGRGMEGKGKGVVGEGVWDKVEKGLSKKAKIWGRSGRVGEDGGCGLDRIGDCGWRLGGWEGEGKDMDLEVWGKGVEGVGVVGEEVCGKEAERVKMVREEGEGVGLEGEGFDDGCGSVKDVREIV